jgi:CRP/FNR family transcriptional regulator
MFTLNFIQKPTQEDLLNAFNESKSQEFEKGSFLFHAGDSIQYFDLLISGEIQIFKYDSHMNELTLNFFHPVSLVAEWAVLQGIPYPAVRFSKKSVIRRLPIFEFRNILQTDVKWNHIIIHSLVQKIDSLNSVVDPGLTMDSIQRVAHFCTITNPIL